MTIAVRALAPPDREAWAGLWRAYLLCADTTLPDAQFSRQFARLTDPDDTRFTGFLAENGTRTPVGLAHCIWHGHGWTEAEVCCLQDLFTIPDARGHGVGRALIAAVFAHADERGADQVYWMTKAGNAAARQLYDRLGHLTPFIKYERAG